MRLIPYLALFCMGLFIHACTDDSEEELFADEGCNTSEVSFTADIFPIIRASCAIVGCHVQGGSGNGIFENYTQVKDKVDNGSMNTRVVVQRTMPVNSMLSDCEVEHFRVWILDGAPNN